MAEKNNQHYEYDVCVVSDDVRMCDLVPGYRDNVKDFLNDMSDNGWELDHPIIHQGNTIGFIFRRLKK